MPRSIFLGLGDIHSNSTLGLCPPLVMLDDEGCYTPSKAQQWLWQCWGDLQGEVKGLLRPGDKVYGVANGDTADANPKTCQLITENRADMVNLAAEIVQPLRDLCVDGFWIVRGTGAHDGPAGSLAELVAYRVGATKYPRDSEHYSCWYLVAKLGGLVFDVAHHAPAGQLPWTKANALGRISAELVDLYLKNHSFPPDVAIRSHRHQLLDSLDNHQVRVICLPSWQLSTEYSHKVATRKPCDIGGVICIIEDGHLEVRHITFRPKGDEAWEPETGTAAGQGTEDVSASRNLNCSPPSWQQILAAAQTNYPER